MKEEDFPPGIGCWCVGIAVAESQRRLQLSAALLLRRRLCCGLSNVITANMTIDQIDPTKGQQMSTF